MTQKASPAAPQTRQDRRVPPKHHPESGTIHVMSTDEYLRWDEVGPGLFQMVPAVNPYEIER